MTQRWILNQVGLIIAYIVKHIGNRDKTTRNKRILFVLSSSLQFASRGLSERFCQVFQWTSYRIRKIAGCAGMRWECRGRFPHHRLKKTPLSDPHMHHGTCVTHVPWCMSGSLTHGGEENVPGTGIPGAWATRNATYLVRGPWYDQELPRQIFKRLHMEQLHRVPLLWTEGQQCGKCLNGMTQSWHILPIMGFGSPL